MPPFEPPAACGEIGGPPVDLGMGGRDMAISESLLPEYDQEIAGVRRTLERVPGACAVYCW